MLRVGGVHRGVGGDRANQWSNLQAAEEVVVVVVVAVVVVKVRLAPPDPVTSTPQMLW